MNGRPAEWSACKVAAIMVAVVLQAGGGWAQVVTELNTTATSLPDWTTTGSTAFSQLGYALDSAGDVNGDGYEDLIVGCIQYANGQSAEGQAQLFLGSPTGLSSSPAWTFESNQASAKLGSSVAGAGDVNNDGYDDVIVGALQYTHGEYREGAAFLFHGSATGLGAAPAVMLEGNQAQEYFGQSVDGAGDVNNDGYADVIVGAHYWDPQGLSDQSDGRALVFAGSASGVTTSPLWQGAEPATWYEYGFRVAGVGDVNGDGFDDVGVAVPAVTGYNGAFVYHGGVSGPSPNANWVAAGGSDSFRIGRAIEGAGDVNGDGYDDLVLGDESGAAHVFHGSSSGLSAAPRWMGTFARVSLPGIRVTFMRGGADVNGDGYDDLLVGASIGQNSYPNPGKVFLVPGSAAGLGSAGWSAAAEDLAATTTFGYGVAMSDVNGDGLSDIFVGDYNYDGGQTRVGKAYGYYSGVDVVVAPTGAVEFGSVDRDSGSSAALFTVSNPEMAPLVLTSAEVMTTGSHSQEFLSSLSLNEPLVIAGGESRQFTITFDPAELGPRAASLEIRTSVPGKESFTIPLSGTGVYQDIQVDTTPIHFGTMTAANLPTSRTVTLSNTGNGNLTFNYPGAAFAPDLAAFSVSSPPTSIAPAGSADVVVTFRKSLAGDYATTLVISSHDPDESSILIPVSGTIRAPRLIVSPPSLTFNRTYTDTGVTTQVHTVTLQNVGNEPLEFVGTGCQILGPGTDYGIGITAGSAPSLSYYLDGASTAPLQVGGSRQWDVRFDPSKVGSNYAALKFLTTDPATIPPTVSLYGQGILSLTSAGSNFYSGFWIRADQDIVSGAEGGVQQWTNAIGPYEVLQPTATSRPALINQGLNGKPVVRFDGTNDFMSLSASPYYGNPAYTFIVVGRPTGSGQTLLGIGNSSATALNLEQSGSSLHFVNRPIYEGAPAGIDLLGGTLTAATGQIMTVTAGTNGTTMALNGQVVATGPTPPYLYHGLPLVFGKTGAMNSGYLNGDIAEAFMVPMTLSSGVIAGIENSLAMKYQLGITSTSTPTIAAGQTGIFRLGNTGIVLNVISNNDPDGWSVTAAAAAGNPGGSLAPGTTALAPNGSSLSPTAIVGGRYWQIHATGMQNVRCYATFDISGLSSALDPERLVIMKRSAANENWVAMPTTRAGQSLTIPVTSFSEFAVGADSVASLTSAMPDWQMYE